MFSGGAEMKYSTQIRFKHVSIQYISFLNSSLSVFPQLLVIGTTRTRLAVHLPSLIGQTNKKQNKNKQTNKQTNKTRHFLWVDDL